MANENEDLKKDGTDKPQHEPSWLEGTLDKLDKDFPLSGGEENDDLVIWEEDSQEEKEAKDKNTKENLDTEYPLSGGETV